MIKDKPLKVQLDFAPVKGIGYGFRQDWIEAKGVDVSAGLDSGAGLGNPMLTFWVKEKGGKTHYFEADMQTVLTKLINTVLHGK